MSLKTFLETVPGTRTPYKSLQNVIHEIKVKSGIPRRVNQIDRYLGDVFISNRPNLTNAYNTLLTQMTLYNTVSNTGKRAVMGFLRIVDFFLDNYDIYTNPNAFFDKDEYKEAFISIFRDDVIVGDKSIIVEEILDELETQDIKQLINDLNNPISIKMSQSTAPSLVSVQSITAPDLTTLRQQFQKPVAGQQFDIEKDVKDYNNYVLYQLANKESIDTDFINEMKRKYPFIFNDTYERNILGYNSIINSGIVRSNINVDYKDLVLPIPSYVEFAKQKQPVNIQTEQNIQNVLSRGYQIIANKGKEVKDEFLSFKQKGDNKFEGKYIQPKLKGSFIVTYNPRYNEYKIVNRNYPTGFVKTGYGIYQYINSLVKKQEKAKQAANPPYMPRVSVAYQ